MFFVICNLLVWSLRIWSDISDQSQQYKKWGNFLNKNPPEILPDENFPQMFPLKDFDIGLD